MTRVSKEASIDLTSIGSWFAEELFTYTRVYGSIIDPHVLPLYVPDKLLAREIAYQMAEKRPYKKSQRLQEIVMACVSDLMRYLCVA